MTDVIQYLCFFFIVIHLVYTNTTLCTGYAVYYTARHNM
jgi:hypothetical protein